MKAFIITHETEAGALRLRLLAEGTNDRTLMSFLEQQYPMIHRLPNSTDGALEVPIASADLLGLPAGKTSLPLCSNTEVEAGSGMTIHSAPWSHAPMLGAWLELQDPEHWFKMTLVINGRPVALDAPCNIYPGTIVELIAYTRPQDSTKRTLTARLTTEDEASPPLFHRVRQASLRQVNGPARQQNP